MSLLLSLFPSLPGATVGDTVINRTDETLVLPPRTHSLVLGRGRDK